MARVRGRGSVQDRDLGWKRLLKDIRTHAGKSYVAVGMLDNQRASREEDNQAGHEYRAPISNTELALIHEFGSPDAHIPERSFLRSTFDRNRHKYLERVRRYVGLVVDGKLAFVKALHLLGMEHAADVKAAIAEGIPPPNAPSTIAAKGSSTPLIDTGQLRNSVSYVVRTQGEGGPVTTAEGG